MHMMDGILRCSRYAFGPNRLHYCGPDANKELYDLIESGKDDFGLENLLKQFKTLFPYLKYIAHSNNISDYFHPKVVEAYWIGNRLVENLDRKSFFGFLIDNLKVRDKMKNKEFRWLEEKIKKGAVPNHSFHVLNIWQQKGHGDALEDLDRINECRISAGTVTAVNGHEISVTTDKLVWREDKMFLEEGIKRNIVRQLESEYDIEQIKPGHIISIHWGVPCEVISPAQAATLRKHTLQNMAFANLNL